MIYQTRRFLILMDLYFMIVLPCDACVYALWMPKRLIPITFSHMHDWKSVHRNLEFIQFLISSFFSFNYDLHFNFINVKPWVFFSVYIIIITDVDIICWCHKAVLIMYFAIRPHYGYCDLISQCTTAFRLLNSHDCVWMRIDFTFRLIVAISLSEGWPI